MSLLEPAGQPVPPFRAAHREASLLAKTRGSLLRYQRACQSLAGGVSSGLRRSARPYPMYYSRGEGSRVVDVDGNQFIDYSLAWGPNILGHPPHAASRAIAAQADRGLTFGAQHDLEFEVAELLVSCIPCAEMIAFGNSGTEIVQVALRLARAVTGRSKFLKFEGHYHGWDDSVLVSYHPSSEEILASGGHPIGAGLGQLSSTHAVVAQWNDQRSVEAEFAKHGNDLAAVICEPLLANSGCIPPVPGFLEFLRRISSEHGTLLIFDEVITGFRLSLGGAQAYFNVTPDLATYAKAVGAGVPLSVLAGPSRYMQYLADGRVVHAGTLNGNLLSLAAAKAALQFLSHGDELVYGELHRRGDWLRSGLLKLLTSIGLSVTGTGAGPVFSISFLAREPKNYRDSLAADKARYSDFALSLLDEGVLVLPDGRWYLSTAHSDADIGATLEAVKRALE